MVAQIAQNVVDILYNDCIDYYVLGLNFDTWFVSPQMCNQLLSHWEDRGDRFNVNPDDDINLIEI